jgi:hypothetical protein
MRKKAHVLFIYLCYALIELHESSEKIDSTLYEM